MDDLEDFMDNYDDEDFEDDDDDDGGGGDDDDDDDEEEQKHTSPNGVVCLPARQWPDVPTNGGQWRGACGLCGKGVYSDQVRGQDDAGQYYHQACYDRDQLRDQRSAQQASSPRRRLHNAKAVDAMLYGAAQSRPPQ